MLSKSFIGTGPFSQNCQIESLPQTLLASVPMILVGQKRNLPVNPKNALKRGNIRTYSKSHISTCSVANSSTTRFNSTPDGCHMYTKGFRSKMVILLVWFDDMIVAASDMALVSEAKQVL